MSAGDGGGTATRRAAESDRYDALAQALLSAPDPVRAIATELGDQAGRLDAVLRRLTSVEHALEARAWAADR